ncbi:MAG: fibronectin type III domain-containing protein [Clostridiales bacterium]|jgi:hypothetical protein|nr:fibronectin type III domain-containing protein [Clostridiales bacterium]
MEKKRFKKTRKTVAAALAVSIAVLSYPQAPFSKTALADGTAAAPVVVGLGALGANSASRQGYTWDASEQTLTITRGGYYDIEGDAPGDTRLEIWSADDVTVTLRGASLENGVFVNTAEPVALALSGDNAVGGVSMTASADVTIKGPGALASAGAIGGGKVTVESGEITASVSGEAAAIGGAGQVIIKGGKVSATAEDGAAIGGGASVQIEGGAVNASSVNGAGIGGNKGEAGGTVKLLGGSVNAVSANGAGIGYGAGLPEDERDAAKAAGQINGAAVYASSVEHTSAPVNSIVIIGNAGRAYGAAEIKNDFTIPAGATLTVPSAPGAASVTIRGGVEFRNNGVIVNNGTITSNTGKVVNNGTISGANASSVPTASAPEAPAGFAAAPSASGATLTWTVPADGGAKITGYQYAVDGYWYVLNGADPAGTKITLSTPTQIKIRAVNAAGFGTESASVSTAPGPASQPGIRVYYDNGGSRLEMADGDNKYADFGPLGTSTTGAAARKYVIRNTDEAAATRSAVILSVTNSPDKFQFSADGSTWVNAPTAANPYVFGSIPAEGEVSFWLRPKTGLTSSDDRPVSVVAVSDQSGSRWTFITMFINYDAPSIKIYKDDVIEELSQTDSYGLLGEFNGTTGASPASKQIAVKNMSNTAAASAAVALAGTNAANFEISADGSSWGSAASLSLAKAQEEGYVKFVNVRPKAGVATTGEQAATVNITSGSVTRNLDVKYGVLAAGSTLPALTATARPDLNTSKHVAAFNASATKFRGGDSTKRAQVDFGTELQNQYTAASYGGGPYTVPVAVTNTGSVTSGYLTAKVENIKRNGEPLVYNNTSLPFRGVRLSSDKLAAGASTAAANETAAKTNFNAIVNYSGLDFGEYTGDLNIYQDGVLAATVTLYFEVLKTVDIKLNPQPIDLGERTAGYADVSKAVTATNIGQSNSDAATAADLTDVKKNGAAFPGTAFTLTGAALGSLAENGGTKDFTVVAANGLAAGVYTANVKIKDKENGADVIRAVAEVKFTVTAPPPAGSAPVTAEGETGFEVNAPDGYNFGTLKKDSYNYDADVPAKRYNIKAAGGASDGSGDASPDEDGGLSVNSTGLIEFINTNPHTTTPASPLSPFWQGQVSTETGAYTVVDFGDQPWDPSLYGPHNLLFGLALKNNWPASSARNISEVPGNTGANHGGEIGADGLENWVPTHTLEAQVWTPATNAWGPLGTIYGGNANILPFDLNANPSKLASGGGISLVGMTPVAPSWTNMQPYGEGTYKLRLVYTAYFEDGTTDSAVVEIRMNMGAPSAAPAPAPSAPATGALDVSFLSGGDNFYLYNGADEDKSAGGFTIPALSVGGAQYQLKIRPHDGLPAGTYRAEVEVKDSVSGVSEIIPVTWTVTPAVYTIDAAYAGGPVGSALNLPPAIKGVNPGDYTFTVTNTGNSPTGDLTVELLNVDDDNDSTEFNLGGGSSAVTSLTPGSSGDIAIQLKDSKWTDEGERAARVKITGGNGISKIFLVKVRVVPGNHHLKMTLDPALPGAATASHTWDDLEYGFAHNNTTPVAITVTNDGAEKVTGAKIRVSSGTSTGFDFLTDTEGTGDAHAVNVPVITLGDLEPGESVTVRIRPYNVISAITTEYIDLISEDGDLEVSAPPTSTPQIQLVAVINNLPDERADEDAAAVTTGGFRFVDVGGNSYWSGASDTMNWNNVEAPENYTNWADPYVAKIKVKSGYGSSDTAHSVSNVNNTTGNNGDNEGTYKFEGRVWLPDTQSWSAWKWVNALGAPGEGDAPFLVNGNVDAVPAGGYSSEFTVTPPPTLTNGEGAYVLQLKYTGYFPDGTSSSCVSEFKIGFGDGPSPTNPVGLAIYDGSANVTGGDVTITGVEAGGTGSNPPEKTLDVWNTSRDVPTGDHVTVSIDNTSDFEIKLPGGTFGTGPVDLGQLDPSNDYKGGPDTGSFIIRPKTGITGAGEHTAAVTITDGAETKTVTVKFVIPPSGAATLAVSPTADQTIPAITAGGSAPTYTRPEITVGNSGTASSQPVTVAIEELKEDGVAYTANAVFNLENGGAPAASLTLGSVSAGGDKTFTIGLNGTAVPSLGAGTYTAYAVVRCDGAVIDKVPVKFIVNDQTRGFNLSYRNVSDTYTGIANPGGSISLNQGGNEFQANNVPALTQTIRVSNIGTAGSGAITAASNAAWLKVTDKGGAATSGVIGDIAASDSDTFLLEVVPDQITTAGTYTATITVADNYGNTQTFTVTLEATASSIAVLYRMNLDIPVPNATTPGTTGSTFNNRFYIGTGGSGTNVSPGAIEEARMHHLPVTGTISWDAFDLSSHYYTATIKLTANSGYKWDASAKASIVEANVQSMTVNNDAEGNTLTAVVKFTKNDGGANYRVTDAAWEDGKIVLTFRDPVSITNKDGIYVSGAGAAHVTNASPVSGSGNPSAGYLKWALAIDGVGNGSVTVEVTRAAFSIPIATLIDATRTVNVTGR